ncbi:helix-turn-helix transcriptional regulator [Lacticaseibacillus saniviri]|uniref:Transcriptional regulator n=1 Tax=Lacticaseibacillus saniviri JCM 17471 = DSM 24301 TaxID=1293598 RepID=A0A0R2MRK6_9LACO|nr:WYL domain-containing protein [Lacticaseibacillus saniviri]KRO16254.1 transcriptional regulator [Lacticaseibacillus saniviri JCM 17471 = DSM 24301]MCG4281468.1 WYL domain-containing protein [Lacticaseibacillus saniviri]
MAINSTQRVAAVLVRLLRGETVTFEDWRVRYGDSKNMRTFQRDIADIRRALAENEWHGELQHTDQGIELVNGTTTNVLQYSVALGQIAVASRAFTRGELKQVLAFLSARLDPTDKQLFNDTLKMAQNSYFPLSRAVPLLARLQTMIDVISAHQRLTFTYASSRPSEHAIQTHEAQPETLFFDRFYFYVVMHLDTGGYRLFRLDRIEQIVRVSDGDKRWSPNHYSLQELREHTHLMDRGSMTTFRFNAWGIYPQTILDQFPQSQMIASCERDGYLFEATAKDMGATMWLLSQGPKIQVVSPPSLVAKIRDDLKAMLQYYPED